MCNPESDVTPAPHPDVKPAAAPKAISPIAAHKRSLNQLDNVDLDVRSLVGRNLRCKQLVRLKIDEVPIPQAPLPRYGYKSAGTEMGITA